MEKRYCGSIIGGHILLRVLCYSAYVTVDYSLSRLMIESWLMDNQA